MYELSLLQFIAVVLLILINAFFVAAEFTLVSIRETRVEQLVAAKAPGARAVRRLQQNLDDLLPAVQLGVTICSLALGWLGEPLAASFLILLFGALPHAHLYAHVVAVTVGFALITYVDVVAGELVPKALALRRTDALALALAPPMLIFMAATKPVLRLLKGGAAVVLRLFHAPLAGRSEVHSAEELKMMASAARRMGMLPEFEERLVHRSLELDELTVREIMTPRQKIFALPSKMNVEEAGARLMANYHARVPVYDETRGPEHIVGVVYARDLTQLLIYSPAPGTRALPFVSLQLGQIMRDVLIVPETKTVLDLLREFQQRRRHLAVVVDEFGSTSGLATSEDAIEQLTGELEDEFDSPAAPALATVDGALLMEGGANLRDLETQMQWNLPREGGVETLAGFLLVQLGHIPHVGEEVLYDGRRLTIEEMDGRRIARIRVEKIPEKPDLESGSVSA